MSCGILLHYLTTTPSSLCVHLPARFEWLKSYARPQIKSKGGLKTIVISHPHFYTTYQEWADTFGCNVIGSNDDLMWLCRSPAPTTMKHVTGSVGSAKEIVQGMHAVKLGGHFPGSLVLHWETKLFVADTFVTVPVSASIYSFQVSPKLLPNNMLWILWNSLILPEVSPNHVSAN